MSKNKKNGNFVVIDCETGGLDPRKHSILSLGVVIVKDWKIVDKKEWFIEHLTYNVTAAAMKINRFDFNNVVENGTWFGDVQQELTTLICKYFRRGDKPRALGHNVGFDLGFIHEQIMAKSSWEEYVSYRNIDTATIANFFIDSGSLDIEKAGLSDLMKCFGLGDEDTEGRHSALFDAERTFKVYEYLVENSWAIA